VGYVERKRGILKRASKSNVHNFGTTETCNSFVNTKVIHKLRKKNLWQESMNGVIELTVGGVDGGVTEAGREPRGEVYTADGSPLWRAFRKKGGALRNVGYKGITNIHLTKSQSFSRGSTAATEERTHDGEEAAKATSREKAWGKSLKICCCKFVFTNW